MWHCEQAFTEARCALWQLLHSCTQCHSEAYVPDGWLTYQQASKLTA